MSENADDKWKELLMDFVHDVASSLTPIQGYSHMLEAYLEKLTQKENVPSVSLLPNNEMTPEMALNMIRIMRKHTELLRELNKAMSHKVGLGTDPTFPL